MKNTTSTALILERAVKAKKHIVAKSNEDLNKALRLMAQALIDNKDSIISANKKDLELAKSHISNVMLDRLRLDAGRISSMADGIIKITELNSPLGIVTSEFRHENGLNIKKVTVPVGVIAIIYESRPNVTSDAAALAIKSGNVCVLRSGKEAHNSSMEITRALRSALVKAGIDENAIQLIEDTDRESAMELMRAEGYIDLLIPRGGKGLIRACVENATVPCIETGTGICHIYVDADADIDMALKIVENAKTSRPSVCNAAEVLLVNREIAGSFLPKLYDVLVKKRVEEGKTPVELRLDSEASDVIDGTLASDIDFDTEFLDYILAVKTVGSLDEAISHIESHSTHHSEAIITNSKENADRFTKEVDSAAVYVNSSTRFTDGGEFGLGCEMGISTQKLHARGPMGISELTTYKYIVLGNGQTR